MGIVQPERRLAYQFASLGDRQPVTSLDEATQIRAIDKFHDEIGSPVELPGIGGRDDIRVAELAYGPHLALKASGRGGIAQTMRRKHLDGHELVEPRVHRPVNAPHSP